MDGFLAVMKVRYFEVLVVSFQEHTVQILSVILRISPSRTLVSRPLCQRGHMMDSDGSISLSINISIDLILMNKMSYHSLL